MAQVAAAIPGILSLASFAARLSGRGAPIAPVGIRVDSNLKGELITFDRAIKGHDRIIARSLNKAVRSARTETRRELAQAKGIPQKTLRNRIKAYFASERRPKAALWVGTGRPIRAHELSGNLRTGAGGTVKIGRRVFRGAFRARMPSGHTGIFLRKPGAKHRQRPDKQMTQLPIEEGIVQLMPEARDISRKAATKHMNTTFRQEARRLARLGLDKRRL